MRGWKSKLGGFVALTRWVFRGLHYDEELAESITHVEDKNRSHWFDSPTNLIASEIYTTHGERALSAKSSATELESAEMPRLRYNSINLTKSPLRAGD